MFLCLSFAFFDLPISADPSFLLVWFSQRATPTAASLVPTKALKLGVSAMLHTAVQSPTRGPQTVEATVVRYREALARGAAMVRAQADTGGAGRNCAEATAQPGAEGEVVQGGAEDAA